MKYRVSQGWLMIYPVNRLLRLSGSDQNGLHCMTGGVGAMKVIACTEDPVVIKQILDHLKHKAEASEPWALPESQRPQVSRSQSWAPIHVRIVHH